MVERAGAHDVETVRPSPLRGGQVCRGLARAVDRERTEGGLFADRQLLWRHRPVDVARRDREHPRRRGTGADGIEHGQRTAQIRAVGGFRVAFGVRRKRQSGEMDDGVGPPGGDECAEPVPIEQVERVERDRQPDESRPFDRRTEDALDRMSAGHERLGDRPASKPADAGHEDEQLIPGARAVLARGVAARCAPPMPPDPIG